MGSSWTYRRIVDTYLRADNERDLDHIESVLAMTACNLFRDVMMTPLKRTFRRSPSEPGKHVEVRCGKGQPCPIKLVSSDRQPLVDGFRRQSRVRHLPDGLPDGLQDM